MLLPRLLLRDLPAHVESAAQRLCRRTFPGGRLIASLLIAVGLAACAAAPAPEPGKAASADVTAQMASDNRTPAVDAEDASTPPSVPRQPSNAEIRKDRQIVDADANAEDADAPSASSQPVVIDTSCKSDKDCTVKNVGNCCGEYPACVNVNSPTDPAGVQAQCAKQGMASICGFPVITGCTCKAGKCESSGDGGIAQ